MIKSRTGLWALFRVGLGSRQGALPSFSSGHILLRSLIFPQNWILWDWLWFLLQRKKMHLLFFSLMQDILAQVLQILLKSKLLVRPCPLYVKLEESRFLR